MLAKEKKNMFMSFRDQRRSVFDEIKVNVRCGLARLKSDNDIPEENTAKISRQLNDMAIEDKTSIDFYKDLRSHYQTHEWRLRNVVYMKKCWKAICCNSFLFKDKVHQV